MDLLEQLLQYQPWNEQEAQDRCELVRWLRSGEPVFHRSHAAAHFTASAWVVSPDFDRVLMAYHNLYRSWAWLGGHADGQQDLLSVAIREVQEESGLCAVAPVTPRIYSLEILSVNGHEKHGHYLSSHLHLNVTYLLQADPASPIRCKTDENSGVAWFPTEEAVSMSCEPWLQSRIYRKLNDKLALYRP